jgi:hypothetical protein
MSVAKNVGHMSVQREGFGVGQLESGAWTS